MPKPVELVSRGDQRHGMGEPGNLPVWPKQITDQQMSNPTIPTWQACSLARHGSHHSGIQTSL
jgi:hypothetical protein